LERLEKQFVALASWYTRLYVDTTLGGKPIALIQGFYYQLRRSVGAVARLNEAVLTYQVLEYAHVRKLRLDPLAALGAPKALLQDCLAAVSIHPDDGYVGPAHHVEVFLEEGGIPRVIFCQACRHEDDAALLRAFS